MLALRCPLFSICYFESKIFSWKDQKDFWLQSDKWNGNILKPLKYPLRDGDVEVDENGAEYRGHYFLNAVSSRKPRIVDLQLQDILDPEEVYSGCFVRLSLNFYPFNAEGNKGVACGLNHIQKIEDGEPAVYAPRPRMISPIRTTLICRLATARSQSRPISLPLPQEVDDILSNINFDAA